MYPPSEPVQPEWPVHQPGTQPTFPPSSSVAVPAPTPPPVSLPAGLHGLNLWLILPILGVTVLWCGAAGLPFNAVALVFALLARAKYDRGDLDRARRHLRRAKIFGIIGLGLAAANITLGITAVITSEVSS